jgi:hypothetical protein
MRGDNAVDAFDTNGDCRSNQRETNYQGRYWLCLAVTIGMVRVRRLSQGWYSGSSAGENVGIESQVIHKPMLE